MPSNDPFARYALSLTAPSFGNLDVAAQSFYQDQDPYKTYQELTSPLATGSGVSGGVRGYMQNPRTFQNAYQQYLAQEGQRMASGKTPNQSWYDFARGYNYGRDFYSMDPRTRGFSLGGGPAMSRLVRGF